MKDSIVKKLTIVIEATNYISLSEEVLNSITALEQLISSRGLKLSLATNDSLIKKETMSNPDYVSPENWDYWPV